MPLVTISVPDHRPVLWRKKIADIVNAAVIETLDFPPDDRYQLIQTLPAEQIDLQCRNRDAVVLQLTMRAGRTSHAKQAFYRRVVDDLATRADVDPASVMIVITENTDADWSFGHGEAQFLAERREAC